MLKSALVTTVATELDDPSNSDVLSLLGDFLDEAIENMAIRFKWSYLNVLKEVTLSSTTSTLEIDGIVDITKIARKTDQVVVRKTTRAWLEQHYNNFELNGPPYWWFIDSFNQDTQAYILGFDQIADDDYDLLVDCKKELGGIADGDHIPFPINMMHIIKYYMRAMWYLNEENQNNADRYEAKYERSLAKYLQVYGKMSAERVMTTQNSDLHFVTPSVGYDLNLDKDRVIQDI